MSVVDRQAEHSWQLLKGSELLAVVDRLSTVGSCRQAGFALLAVVDRLSTLGRCIDRLSLFCFERQTGFVTRSQRTRVRYQQRTTSSYVIPWPCLAGTKCFAISDRTIAVFVDLAEIRERYFQTCPLTTLFMTTCVENICTYLKETDIYHQP